MGIFINKSYSKFRFFMFAYWGFMLSIAGMYTMYLVEKGFTKKEISIAVSIFTISSLLGQNVLGYLADRFKHTKVIFLTSMGIGISAAAGMILTNNILLVYSMVFIWGATLYGTIPLSEAWYIRFLKKTGSENEFGRIRGFGSVGYSLSGVLIGLLLERFGWNVYLFYILISACFMVMSVLLIADDSNSEKNLTNKTEREKVSFREALSQIASIKPLRYIVIILFMYAFVVKGIYSYLGILVSDSGGGPLSLGVAYFFDAGPEVITFFLATRLLTRYSSKSMIFVSFIIQILRLSLILVFNNSLAIILLGMLSGFAYGLQAAAYKTYIYNLAPEKYKISCLSISESIISLSGVICAPVFGFVILKFGVYSSIAMGLTIEIAAALLIGFNLLKDRKKAAV